MTLGPIDDSLPRTDTLRTPVVATHCGLRCSSMMCNPWPAPELYHLDDAPKRVAPPCTPNRLIVCVWFRSSATLRPKASPKRPNWGDGWVAMSRDSGPIGVARKVNVWKARPTSTAVDSQFRAPRRRRLMAQHPYPSRTKIESTDAGEQHVIPGAEKVSDAEVAKRKAGEPLKLKAEQKPADEGSFGDRANQTDLIDRAGRLEAVKPRN